MGFSKTQRDAVQRKLDSWGIKRCTVLSDGAIMDRDTQNQVGYIESVIWNLNSFAVDGLAREIRFIHFKAGRDMQQIQPTVKPRNVW